VVRAYIKILGIVADIKKKRLEWMGHLARLDHRKVVTKIFAFNLLGRGMGRRRLRLLEDVKRICGR
jgi:hypothetical protein